jgi:dTDP-4-dehydrorhamnose reductase
MASSKKGLNILVTGSNGMLGTSVKKVFKDHNLILTDINELDVRNIQQVMFYTSFKLDVILHLAAETDLIKAQFNPADAYLTNHTGTQNMVELAKTLEIPIVYIGTAGIFDGQKKIYTENDSANPIHHYGRSKYFGEIAVKSYPKHYIVRGGWGMGGGPKIDKKFINKVFKQIQQGQKTLYGIKDIYGNPTYAVDLAKTIKNILESQAEFGTYHSSGKGVASRFEVLKAFVNFLGLSRKLKLIPLTYKEYSKLFPLQTPPTRSEVLSIVKLENTGLSAMRDWQLALSDYAKEFKT